MIPYLLNYVINEHLTTGNSYYTLHTTPTAHKVDLKKYIVSTQHPHGKFIKINSKKIPAKT